jgi:hypothetical protein
VADGSFARHFPLVCPDAARGLPFATDRGAFWRAALSETDITTPLHQTQERLAILDLVEFCYNAVARPIPVDHHSYYGHTHLTFDEPEGKGEFRTVINRIFTRNGLVYELQDSGQIRRLGSEVIHSAPEAKHRTGDSRLDVLLETAVAEYLSPDPVVRRESLEPLWDAWERLKTLESVDKKSGIKELLDRAASEPYLRAVLETEANTLTDLGNELMIRHFEITKREVENDKQVDYLFERLYALIRLTLRATNRL